MPPADRFVLKGSVFLVLGTAARTSGSIWIYSEYQSHKSIDKQVKRPALFGAAATELGLEIPVYLYLIVMYSFLFSTYKLYLMLKEMFALNNQDEEEKEGDAEEGDLGASTGTTSEAGD